MRIPTLVLPGMSVSCSFRLRYSLSARERRLRGGWRTVRRHPCASPAAWRHGAAERVKKVSPATSPHRRRVDEDLPRVHRLPVDLFRALPFRAMVHTRASTRADKPPMPPVSRPRAAGPSALLRPPTRPASSLRGICGSTSRLPRRCWLRGRPSGRTGSSRRRGTPPTPAATVRSSCRYSRSCCTS